ncbi:hypothetical protein SI65_03725 [Aspergillus cristatus]|uniref:Cell wall galactomannoprotein n=1 Tax=Aspergillus cristatus TaxID=573508 RepID=A0A1E3BI71_ASPCR|nr:hypothetical protein SI65_03725 [Aspergillus cristatus]
MLFKEFLLSALLAPLVSIQPLSLAATTTDHVFLGFDSLHKQILSTHDCVKNFDGGAGQTLLCGYELYNLMTSSNSARKTLADLDSVPADQVYTYLSHYHDIRTSIKEILNTASSKTDHLDSAGLKAFATIILRGFAKERATYETLSKQKLPVDNHTELAGPVKNLGNEFEKALADFL